MRTPVAVKLEGEDVLAEIERRGAGTNGLVPVEATAGLAMLLLRDHGILTVHFAALPPGTSALLLKFVPPETLDALRRRRSASPPRSTSRSTSWPASSRPASCRALLGL